MHEIEAIRSTFLGKRGASVLLLGPPKIGKSCLLERIYSSDEGNANVLCRISLDDLRAQLGPDEHLSDTVFLSFFVDWLQKWLKGSVTEQSAREEEWKGAIEETDIRLEEIDGNSASQVRRRQALEQKKKAYFERLRELNTMRKSLKKMDELGVERPIRSQDERRIRSQKDVSYSEVASVLHDVQRVGKRIVLFIDDFHQMLRELGFSDRLFFFLRGASNEGTMSILASSPIHLMDPSLHASRDRTDLLNHFELYLLSPFSDELADGFLDWLSAEQPLLTSEEKTYLRELGGGFPYFLKIAYEQFVLKQKPRPPERADFERSDIATHFESGFREMWEELSAVKRALLRDATAGKAIALGSETAMSLRGDGYLVLKGETARLFSRPFADFAARQTD